MRIEPRKKEIQSEKKNGEERKFISILNRVIVRVYDCERDPDRMRESTSLLVASENLGHSVRSREMKALL
jgi:hypothetical protein